MGHISAEATVFNDFSFQRRTLKGKNLLLLEQIQMEQILSFKTRSHLAKSSLSREANMKSERLFPFDNG